MTREISSKSTSVILIFRSSEISLTEERTLEQDIIVILLVHVLKPGIGLVGIGSLAEQFLIT
jgi:hypothetical protein